MTNLSPKAQQALENLRMLDAEYRKRKSEIELDLRARLNDLLTETRRERDNALALAAQLGVPRTQLGKAIGTSNYRTVQEILASVAPEMKHSENGWSLVRGSEKDTYTLQVTALGVGRVTGSATVGVKDGDIYFISGDAFVLPNIYREGLAEEVIASAI